MSSNMVRVCLLNTFCVRVCDHLGGWTEQGHQLNSPNDLAFSKKGDLYFTDPPYGMPQKEKNPDYGGKSGVYRVKKEALDAARADAEAAPEPELLEDGPFFSFEMLLQAVCVLVPNCSNSRIALKQELWKCNVLLLRKIP